MAQLYRLQQKTLIRKTIDNQTEEMKERYKIEDKDRN
jgi:hypothetical protein